MGSPWVPALCAIEPDCAAVGKEGRSGQLITDDTFVLDQCQGKAPRGEVVDIDFLQPQAGFALAQQYIRTAGSCKFYLPCVFRQYCDPRYLFMRLRASCVR
jgi:hypothetical protein